MCLWSEVWINFNIQISISILDFFSPKALKNTVKVTEGRLSSNLRGFLPLWGRPAFGERAQEESKRAEFVYIKYCNDFCT